MEDPQNQLPTEAEIEREATRPQDWPMSILRIAKPEKPMFFRMATMFMLIAFIYSVLRDTKDAVILDKQEPSSINILKTIYVTPCSMIFVFLIQSLLSRNTVSKILKGSVLVFGLYFVIYGVLLLYIRDWVEPDPICSDSLFCDAKMSFRGLQIILSILKTFNFWTGSLLYVTAELWGNIVLSLLFLNYSNEVCTPKQNLRFVPIFYIFSNFELFFSGLTMLLFCYIQETFSYAVNRLVLNMIVVTMGVVCLAIYFIHLNLEKSVLSKPIFVPEKVLSKKKKKKPEFVEGILYMTKSYLLINICFIVLAYNITANFTDSVFKSTMSAHAKATGLNTSSSVMKTQAWNQIVISLCVIILLCTPFARLTQFVGWAVTGYITPIFGMIGSIFIFGFATYNTGAGATNGWSVINSWVKGKAPYLEPELLAGRVASAGLKVFKYAAFDIAKEAISVRINPADRPMFKGVYDGICGKMGKTGGSIMITFFTAISNTTDIRNAAQYCFLISPLLNLCALYSITYLGKKYNASVTANAEICLDMIGKKKKDIEI